MTDPLLARHNKLTQLANGVWVKADEAERSFIDYSDGDSAENRVYEQIAAAQDRSVYSSELDHPWEEWALEYHLGSKRANVYRGLNLEGVEKVLEVGCGCGAITRFLGERGFRLDAIEGTLRRAQIARLRSEELDNVQIVCSNYHELTLPENHYDLVVFTGVLEYSGAYSEAGVSPEAQLQATLQSAQKVLTENGQILIAIENRTGFKYLAGASEDHLNVANIGLLEYREPACGEITRGIRTWSKREWQQILGGLGFDHFAFCYPFPDYKLPDVVLSDNFLATMRYPDQVLSGLFSRDYSATWWPAIPEPLFWRTAAQTGSIDQFANSFLIVIANREPQLARTIDFDFVHFASISRRLPYRLQVVKKRGEDAVHRFPVRQVEQPQPEVVRQERIDAEAYIDGQVLEQCWRQALRVNPSYDELAEHIRIYGRWLDELIADGAKEYIDAVPGNIVVGPRGNWHLFDQEWQASEEPGREIILFRALLNFVLNARELLADLELNAARQALGIQGETMQTPFVETLDDFIAWGMGLLGVDFAAHRARCLDFERRLHRQVTCAQLASDLDSVLSTPIYQWHASQSFDAPATPMEVRVFWSQVSGVWHIDHSAGAPANFAEGLNVSLELPQDLQTHRFVRVDLPADVLQNYRGWLEFRGLSISVLREGEKAQRVFHLEGLAQLLGQGRISGLREIGGERLMVTSSQASLLLDLEQVAWGEGVTSIQLALVIDIAPAEDLVMARQLLHEESVRAAYRVRLREHILRNQEQRIRGADRHLAEVERKLQQIERRMAHPNTRIDKVLGKFGLYRRFKEQ